MDHCFCIKRLFLTVIFFIVVSVLCTQLSAQKRNKKYDRELVTFMNYVRDSVLKTDSWAEDNTLGMQKFSGYIPQGFEKNLEDSCADIFDEQQRLFIVGKLKNRSPVVLTRDIFRKAHKANTDSLSSYYHRLYILREKINAYILNPANDLMCDKRIYMDSLHVIIKDDSNVVENIVRKYNNLVDHIKKIKEEQSYWYILSAPIFLNNYRYCVFEYCDYKNFRFYINLYVKTNHKWKFVKTISFFSSITIIGN